MQLLYRDFLFQQDVKQIAVMNSLRIITHGVNHDRYIQAIESIFQQLIFEAIAE